MRHQDVDYGHFLRSRGLRLTPQRQLILNAIRSGDGHLGFEEIAARVWGRTPALSRATIYRTLNLFCRLGIAVSAEFGDGRTVYEIAHPTPHQHLVCRSCGDMAQVRDAAFSTLVDSIAAQGGFRVEGNHTVFTGLCANCQAAEEQPGGKPSAELNLGASLGRWNEQDLISRLQEMAQVVNATAIFPYPFNLPLPSALLRDARDASQELGLVLLVHGPIWEVYTASIYPDVRALGVQKVREAVDFAAALGAGHITVHPGANAWPDVWPALEKQALAAQLRSLDEITRYAGEVGVAVGIENMLPGDGCLTGYDDFTEIERVLAQVDGIGVTLDVGHAFLTGLDVPALIRSLGTRLNHVHAHDNHGKWDEHLPVGEGLIDWEPICRALLEVDYSGVVEVERSLADGGVQDSLIRLKACLESTP